MANDIFLADTSIPGQSAADLTRRAADAISGLLSPLRGRATRTAFRSADRHLLQDLGLDRSAC